MNMTPTLQESQKLLRDASAEIKEIAESITQVSMQAKKDRLLECLETIKNADDKIEQSINFMYFGQKSGGQRKTARKIKAVQENGKKGGRPSKKILQTLEKSLEGDDITVFFSDGSQTKISGSAFDVRTRFPLSRYRWSDEAEEWFTKNC
ncbi:MAG: hypothetical protein K6F15_11090 [Treponema sp.]|nr:hypothetical protein [Treponema sp.]